jgi:hypothetical protein
MITTAVGPDAAHHLRDAHSSIRSQQLPAGRQVEWLAQRDGGYPDEPRRFLPDE